MWLLGKQVEVSVSFALTIVFFLFQLCAVYLFEYIAQGCAAKVRPKKEYNIGCPELYASLSLCYQVFRGI